MCSKEPTIHELRELVQEASRANPHLTSRLERAAFLVVLRRFVSLGRDRYEVGSEDGLRTYEVLNGHCQCSDYVRHGSGHPCKHRLTVALYLELRGLASSWRSVSGSADSAVGKRALRI